jgi:hypothetical protein
MTKLLDQAVQIARSLPVDVQDDIARIVLALAGVDQSTFQLTPDEETSFEKSRAQAARREFATDEQVQAIWSKHD